MNKIGMIRMIDFMGHILFYHVYHAYPVNHVFLKRKPQRQEPQRELKMMKR